MTSWWQWLLLIAGLCLLPFIVFLTVKLGTAGFYFGRESFERYKQQQKEQEHGVD